MKNDLYFEHKDQTIVSGGPLEEVKTMRENTKTFILKSGRRRLQEVVVYYKALSGKILKCFG